MPACMCLPACMDVYMFVCACVWRMGGTEGIGSQNKRTGACSRGPKAREGRVGEREVLLGEMGVGSEVRVEIRERGGALRGERFK